MVRYGSLSFVYSCFFHLTRLPTSSSHSSISAASLSSRTPLLPRGVSETPSSALKKVGFRSRARSHASWLQEAEMIANAANTMSSNENKREKKDCLWLAGGGPAAVCTLFPVRAWGFLRALRFAHAVQRGACEVN